MLHRSGSLGALVLTVLVAALAPAAAPAHPGDGVFLLAGPAPTDATGVLMLPDASVLVAAGSVRRLTPDGRSSTIPGLGATGLALASDGSVLAVDARPQQNVVRGWRPGGPVEVIAGRRGGPPGFAGDGGPATGARLGLSVREPLSSGVLALPLGGFLFADGDNQRVRGVDPTGVIRTVAGSGRVAGPGSARLRDGGPALAAAFGEPAGLAATAGGGYLVAERRGRRLRRVRPDGIVETVVGGLTDPRGVAVLADGTTVFTDAGLPWAIPRRARRPVPLFRRNPSEPDDFAGRLVTGDGVAHDGRGGLLLAGAAGVVYAPRGPTPWPLAALRATRIARRSLRAVLETTRPGVATLEVSRRGRVLARATRPVGAGHTTLQASTNVPPDWLRVTIDVRFRNGSTRRDAVTVHGAPRLATRLARRRLAPAGRCRAFGPRRVDCRLTDADGSCAATASLRLASTGVVLQRRYACGAFRRQPRWDDAFGAVVQGPS